LLLWSAVSGDILMAVIWGGEMSNGCVWLGLLVYGTGGAWSAWSLPLQMIAWGSIAATALFTLGLLVFGVFGPGPRVR